MMKKSMKIAAASLAALAMAGMMTGCGMSGGDKKAAASGNGQKVELKLAYQLPSEHHLSKSVEKFAKEVNDRSKGSIEVKVYPAGQLYNDQNMNDALMSGGAGYRSELYRTLVHGRTGTQGSRPAVRPADHRSG